MAQNNHIRERLDEVLAKAPKESQWWSSRRAEISGSFMKELEEEPAKGGLKIGSDDASSIGTPCCDSLLRICRPRIEMPRPHPARASGS